MSQSIYIAELTANDPLLATTRTLRYSRGMGYTTKPTDSVPNEFYAPRIKQPIDVSRNIFAPGKTGGGTRTGYGELVLLNGDGELDDLLTLGLDGRRIVVWRTEKRNPRYLTDFRLVLVATMEQPEFSGNVVTVRLQDRQVELDVPLQTTKFAGSNALPAGLEGVESDLKGKPKPVCYGEPMNVAPPCVNTSRLIYQVNDGPVASVTAVYDRGVALTKGADYVSQSDMETTAPAASNFRVWPAGGYFRLGSSPAGLVTCDPIQGASAAERTAAQIYTQLIARALLANPSAQPLGQQLFASLSTGDTLVTSTGDSFVASGDVNNADIAALDLADSSVLGFWETEEATVSGVCDLVAETVGAWWGVDREGVFRIKRFAGPVAPEYVAAFGPKDLLKPLERLATLDESKGIPAWRQIVRWGKNYNVQASDMAGSVTDARRAVISKEWREASASDTNVQAIHLLSPEMKYDSLFTTAIAAQNEADRRLALRSIRRDRFELRVQLTDESDSIDLGQTVYLTHHRYGLSITGDELGKPFVVMAVDLDAQANALTLGVWGTSLDNFSASSGEIFVTSDGLYLLPQAA